MNITHHDSLIHNIFGRRHERFVLRGGCCKGNMCNAYPFLFTSSNPSPSTTVTHLQSTIYTNQGTSHHVPSLSGVSQHVPTTPLATTSNSLGDYINSYIHLTLMQFYFIDFFSDNKMEKMWSYRQWNNSSQETKWQWNHQLKVTIRPSNIR